MKGSSLNPNVKSRRQSRLKNDTGTANGASNSGGGGASPRKQRESIQEVIPVAVEVEDVADEDPDELENLRFSEKRCAHEQREDSKLPDIEWKTQTVYVVRRRPELDSETPATPKSNLLLPVGLKEEELTVYEGPCGLPRRGVEALHIHRGRDHFLPPLSHRSVKGQEAALSNWDRSVQTWDSGRLHVGQVLGVPENSLLMAQPMPLPPVQNHRGTSFGPDSDFPQYTQKERAYQEDAFFRTPDRIGDPEDELMCTLPWAERKFYEPPVTTVRPMLREQPPFEYLSLSSQSRSLEAIGEAEEELKHILVRGRQIRKEDEDVESAMTEQMELSWADSDFSSHRTMDLSHVTPRYNALSGGPVSNSTAQYYTRHSVPAIQLGRFIYIWGQPSVKGLVEVGTVANVGESSTTYIFLTNVGCCVTRYSWRQLPSHDFFNTGRTRRSPFIFDFGDGCLLPEQRISIPVQFRSPLPGCWRERWLLETVPRLYSRRDPGDSEICLSLWGQAIEVDVNLSKRLELDKDLEHKAIVRMAQRWIDDLLNNLPLRSVEEQLRAAIKRRKDLFKQGFQAAYEADVLAHFSRLNPSLHYHSAALAQVGAVRHDLQLLKKAGSHGQLLPMSEISGLPLGIRTRRKSGLPSSQRRKSRKNSQIKMVDNTMPPHLQDRDSQDLDQQDLLKLKQQVAMGSVIREVHTSLSEDIQQKEELLCIVNSAIITMSAPPFSPTMSHTNKLFVRAGLVQLMDKLAAMEIRLRHTLGLQDDPRFQMLTTFPLLYRRSSRAAHKKRVRSVSSIRKVNPTVSRQSTVNLSFEDSHESFSEPVVWEDPLPTQYHRKLYALIYGLLASDLPALFPLVTQKELRPNFPR